jgi:TetR/AcrR family transcriptional regulator, transcriptional repressor for nem operon
MMFVIRLYFDHHLLQAPQDLRFSERPPMRRTREDTAATHAHIIDTAARLFRERGINGIGVADLMGEAGLTHGGFYKHFESKDALAGEACAAALAQGRAELARRADAAPDEDGLKALLTLYLSPAHRDQPGLGCTIAAIGAEAIRYEGPAREALAEGVGELLQLIHRQMARSQVDETRLPAHVVLATMVGALLLSRTVQEPTLAKAILRDTRAMILNAAQSSSTPHSEAP